MKKINMQFEVLLRMLIVFAVVFVLAGQVAAQTWTLTGSLGTERFLPTATLLPNGKVLIAGGHSGTNGIVALSSAELYDPTAEVFSPTGSMLTPRIEGHSATLLPNGKVLISGGVNLSSAELYDPATEVFSATGSMPTPRTFHTSTLLPNGKVLITGGGGFGFQSSALLYDPATGTFTSTGSMSTGRYAHSATLLPNGKVLVAGGWCGDVCSRASAELYDPTTGTWSTTGSMATARSAPNATLLPNGKVLVAGGWSGGIGPAFASAELYDPSTGTWSATGSMSIPRFLSFNASILLPNGKVLVEGGTGFGLVLASAELYDPSTGTWSATSSMTTARFYQAATLLSNGKVLVTGGAEIVNGSWIPINSAELYTSVTPNQPPIANAGPAQTVHAGSPVTLDGSGSSDPDNNVPLTYDWSFISRPAGSTASLSNPIAVNPTFTPDIPGDYQILLIVTDSLGTSSSSSTLISTVNTPPVAEAGQDQLIINIGTTVQLNGGQSFDVDGDPVTYQWTFVSKPSGSAASLSGANSSTSTFMADIHGSYAIQLVVSDPWTQGVPDSVTVSFENLKPVANAGISQSVVVGNPVTLV